MRTAGSTGRATRVLTSLALLATMIAVSPATVPATTTQAPTTPFNFQMLGHDGGVYTSLDTIGTALLAVEGSALVALDLSDSALPQTGAAPIPWSGGSLYASGSRGYVVGSHQFAIYDLSSPGSPRYRGLWELSSDYTITGFFAKGDYAYVGWEKSGYTGTKVVDVSDPLNTSIVSYPSMTLLDLRPDVVGDLVFAVGDTGVDVYDLSSPLYPTLFGSVDVEDCLDAVHDGNYLYISTGDPGVDTGDLQIYEQVVAAPGSVTPATLPADPEAEWTLVGSAPAGCGMSLDVAADRLWRATTTGVELWNVATRSNPGLVELDALDGALQVAAAADFQHAFVLSSADLKASSQITGFETITVSGFDTEYVSLEGFAGDSGIDIVEDMACISSASGLRTVNLSDPAAIEVLGTAETTETANDVDYFDGDAYVATGDGLWVYDLTNPYAPTLVGGCERAGGYERVKVTTDTVFATYGTGLVAIDASDPAHAEEIGSWAAPKKVWDLDVNPETERAYVVYALEGATDSTLVMLDVSDPTAPDVLNTHGIPGGMPSVSTFGDYAYVGMMNPTWGGSSVKVFDVSSGTYLDYKHMYDIGSWNGSDVFATDGELLTVGKALQKWGIYSPTMPYLMGYAPEGGERVGALGDLVGVCSDEGGTTFYGYDAVSFRSFGGDRYDTSVMMSREFESSEYVVLATGRSFPDALAGVPLAYALDAPILLVGSNSIPAEVLDEIDRLGATKAYVLGGDAAVGPGVVDQLVNAGFSSGDITRLWGLTRYDTARAIAEELQKVLGGGDIDKVFIATGTNFPDALAASGVAARAGCPILLVKPADLTSAARRAIDDLGADEVVIVGGEAAVGSGVVADLNAAGIATGDIERLSGIDRYATAREIAEWALADPGAGFDCDDIFVVTGTNFPDALSCGPVAAGDAAPTVLVSSSLPAATKAFVTEHAEEIDEVNVVGGAAAVSTEIERWLVVYSE